MVEKEFKLKERQSIVNIDVLSMLINCLPHIADAGDQLWLAQNLRDVSCSSEKNRMICCDNGVILVSMKCVEQLCANNKPTNGQSAALIFLNASKPVLSVLCCTITVVLWSYVRIERLDRKPSL